MSRIPRVCRLLSEDQSFLALPAIVVVGGVFLVMHTFVGFGCLSGATVRPGEYLLNCWMLLLLGASYVVWAFLRDRGIVNPGGAQGFVLATYGCWMRVYLFFIIYGLSETYGDHSVVEDLAGSEGGFLIRAHRYGGLLAFALGLALVAWGSRWPATAEPGRAAGARSGPPPAAGPAGRAPRKATRPSSAGSGPRSGT